MPKTLRADQQGPQRQQLAANRKIIYATESVCWICGEPVDKSLKSPHPMSKTVDHKIPLARGGHPSDLDNLALAHRRCNRLKSDKLPADLKGMNSKPQQETPQPFPEVTRDWRTA